MSDEKYYLQAEREIEAGLEDTALMSKSRALSSGDEAEAKYRYIKLRVAQLKRSSVENKFKNAARSGSSTAYSAWKHSPRKTFFALFAILWGLIGLAVLGEGRHSDEEIIGILLVYFIPAIVGIRFLLRNRRKNIDTHRTIEIDYPKGDYGNWEAWYQEFKREAERFNSKLEVDEEGKSLIDFMDKSPLEAAFNDGVDPKFLAKEFASQFNLDDFGSTKK